MRSTIQESVVGQIIYHFSKRRWFQYPEEIDGFVVPERYRLKTTIINDNQNEIVHRGPTSRSSSADTAVDSPANGRSGVDGGKEIVVDWYGPDDPENPQNWSLVKKCWLVWCIMLITTSVYIGSSIYSPAIVGGAEYFGVSEIVSVLGLSLFVVGYGIGPLFLAPITEIPQIGRNLPYIVPLAIFCILQIPTALVDNFVGFCILRFIAGFVSSPPLATGGASLFDVFSQKKITYPMGLYDLACAAGPTLGPIVAGFAVVANGWRWAFWGMLWITGFALAMLSFTMPETFPENILHRRADRLRRLTGNSNIRSPAEINSPISQDGSSSINLGGLILEAIWRPIQMTFREPIIIAVNLYIGYVYALLYSYFESFPLVYGPEGYDFPGGVQYLPFAALLVGEVFSFVGYALWAWYYYEKKFDECRGVIQPETALPMGIPGAFGLPISLFWLAWSANRTHWMAPVMSHFVFGACTTWMFMPFLTYLPLAYPRYAASSLASNDFVRSMLGAAMPLASYPLFHNLGIDWGNTLLGFVSLVFLPIPWLLFAYGGRLRNISPMALHDDQLEEMRGDLASSSAERKKCEGANVELSTFGSPSRCPRRLSGVSNVAR